ncbi:hypothetical protein P3094_19425 [Salmonella enterica subsp. enterica serovar Mbandaka]|uniref:hypothetical protein n=1 Tax=Enterobacterales TaxID=91347 RepID=UPI001F1EE6AC|nr:MULTISPECIES: hypothetical protein [Enterobacteriaceae]MCG0134812.1 hypothetical protein [Escherichia coli]WDF22463.1 hypothetical protein PTZ66_05765 [Salmonella enterica subsp. enterica serovar Mbandaka]WPD32470.1 hypothetical protein P3094_19425 [Salmonella enterica subsp. enterica serovar Mbandaka]
MAIALMGAGFSATDTSDAVNILYPITMTVQANKAWQASGLKKSFFYHPTKSSWWRKDKLCKALGDVVFQDDEERFGARCNIGASHER